MSHRQSSYYDIYDFMQRMDVRQQELEERLNAIQPPNSARPNYPGAVSAQSNSTPVSPQTPIFIPVKSAEEAWNYKVPHWQLVGEGKKFIFYDMDSMEIHLLWYNAKVPEMVQATASFAKQPMPVVPPVVPEPEPQASAFDFNATLDVVGKVNHIENQLSQIMEMLTPKQPVPQPEQPTTKRTPKHLKEGDGAE